MALLNLQMPERVVMNDEIENTGIFEFRPLEPGFGLTVGNALRRVLLSSLEGHAITYLKIEGVDHEFSTISGIVEDVTEIVLSLKQVRLKQQVEGIDTETVKVSLTNKKQITAGDLQQFISGYTVINQDLVICNLTEKTQIDFEFVIQKGRGFVLAEDNKKENAPIGGISMDSIYTPIKNVSYKIENYRVGQKTDFEKLVFEITSDGTIDPKDALTEAAKILIRHFMLFSDDKIDLESEVASTNEEYDEESLYIRQMLKSKLTNLNISVRALNCLKAADVETLGDLVSYNKSDLMKFRNFGKKSLVELEELVDSKKLTFGMDLSKYKL